MKINRKLFIILAIFLITIATFSTSLFAASDLQNISEEGKKMIDLGRDLFNNAGMNTSDITSEIVPIAKALVTIGIGVILIVGVIMGIKWVSAKPDQQAKLKEQSIGLLVAAIVIVGSYTIWSVALKIASKF